ncbi:unnamed protein product [Hapterophycus canaliculatus]
MILRSTFGNCAVQYLASLYWTIATLMSVGYGDIPANNNRERMFALVTMVSNSRRPCYTA